MCSELTHMEKNESAEQETEFVSNLRELSSSGLHSDVTLIVQGGVALPAHRAILAARSRVFAEMLRGCPPAEDVAKKITITATDVRVDVMRALLEFVYTGEVQQLASLAEPLLKAADKFSMPDLVSKCEKSLTSLMTVDTAVHLLQVADSCRAKHLKTASLDFIKTNAVAVQMTDGWRNLAKSDSDLATEVLPVMLRMEHVTSCGMVSPSTTLTVEKTSLNVVETQFVWRLENFSYFDRAPVVSQSFCCRDNPKVTWRVQVHPRGDTGLNEYVAVFLQLATSPRYPIRARYQFALLDRTATKKNWKSSGNEPQEFTHVLRTFGYPNFIKRSSLMRPKNRLLHNDTLVLYCEVEAISPHPPTHTRK